MNKPDNLTDNIGAYAIIFILIRETFGGAILFYLYESHMQSLWFAPDVICASCIALMAFTTIKNLNNGLFYVALIAAIIIYPVFTGLFYNTSYVAITSSLKVFFPLILLVSNRRIADVLFKFRNIYIFLLIITLTFVYLAAVITFPWVGYSVEKFGVTSQAGRLWWDGQGAVRNGGATMGSFSAGMLIAFLFGMVMVRKGFSLFSFLLWPLCIFGEYLTTYKTGLVCVIIMPLALGNFKKLARRDNTDLSFMPMAYVMLFGASWLLPFFLGIVLPRSNYFVSSGEVSSLYDRILNTWPGVFAYMNDKYGWSSFIFGSGFGSFGSGSRYNNTYIGPVSDLDNGFLYTYVNYGALAIFLFMIMTSKIADANSRPARTSILLYSILAFTTGLEGCVILISLGMAISELFPQRNRKASSQPMPPRNTTAHAWPG